MEVVLRSDDGVAVPAIEPGRNVRPRGGDVRAGDVVVPAGARLGVAQIGALAALGLSQVSCARRPRVAVVPTGSELRRAGAALGPGEIFESNGAMLAASLSSVGAHVDVRPVAGDDLDVHRRAIAEGLSYDVLITSGGVSVGPHDLVRRVEEELGVSEIFWGVAVKPGKPLSVGVRGSTLVCGLPGHPAPARGGARLFLQPAVLALPGASDPGPAWEAGVAGRPFQRNAHRDELVRSSRRLADDRVVLHPAPGQESHMIVRAAAADVVTLVPRGEGSLPEGSPVRYLSLG
jgi:molybdopterin molybdotransferase